MDGSGVEGGGWAGVEREVEFGGEDVGEDSVLEEVQSQPIAAVDEVDIAEVAVVCYILDVSWRAEDTFSD